MNHLNTGYTSFSTAYSRRRFLELAFGVGVVSILGCDSNEDVSSAIKPFGTKKVLPDLSQDTLNRFVQSFDGKIVMPSDSSYESLRRTWNYKYDKHPGMIAVCANVDDVRRTVAFASENQLLLAVRGGGHSMAGYSSCNGGITLILSNLNTVTVDKKNNKAEILGGTIIGSIDFKLSEYGLATPGASAATVGYGGFATGGGRATISPKYGLACDNIVGAEIVTADGELRNVSMESDPDLFWAIRGGGGNYGVITRFTVQAHSLSKVVAGKLVFPFKNASDILKKIRDQVQSVPDFLYVAPALAGTPDGPAFAVNLLFCGPKEQAETTIARYREMGNAVADTITELPYLNTQGWFPGPPIGTATEGCSGFFPVFTDEIIDAMITAADSGPSAFAIPCFSNHGALADQRYDNNAFPLRMKGVDFFAMGFWTSPTDRERTEKWARDLWLSVAASAESSFVNGFFKGNSVDALASYRDKYQKLAAIKARYDPDNLFSQNVNILPAN